MAKPPPRAGEVLRPREANFSAAAVVVWCRSRVVGHWLGSSGPAGRPPVCRELSPVARLVGQRRAEQVARDRAPTDARKCTWRDRGAGAVGDVKAWPLCTHECAGWLAIIVSDPLAQKRHEQRSDREVSTEVVMYLYLCLHAFSRSYFFLTALHTYHAKNTYGLFGVRTSRTMEMAVFFMLHLNGIDVTYGRTCQCRRCLTSYRSFHAPGSSRPCKQ